MSKVNLKEVRTGDIFSEVSHFVLKSIDKNVYVFSHTESGEEVKLQGRYVQDLLTTADQYPKEAVVEVGKEDKHWTLKQIAELPVAEQKDLREGDIRTKGIRTIWSDIHGYDVFAVCFNKQDKPKTKRALQAELDTQILNVSEALELVKKNKKGVTEAAKELLKTISENPVLDYIPGEERVLRGYKTQFSSTSGYYDVIDMELPAGSNKRQVNINEIKWLIYHGVRYNVK